MKIKHLTVPTYLSPSKLPNSDYVINPYIGCSHGCKYCYACFMKKFTGHTEPWGAFIDIKHCDQKINPKKIAGKNIFLSSVTDCYNHFEEEHQITRSILEQLIPTTCHLSICTKSKLILRDLDLLKQMSDLTVAMSVNTLDENFKNDMDNASSIADRLTTLKTLHQNGLKTVLFMSPIFPYITDFKAIVEVSKNFIDEYWFENLNLRGPYKKTILDYIKTNYPQHYPAYLTIYLHNDLSYWQSLSQEIEIYCTQNNIKYSNFFYHEQLVKK